MACRWAGLRLESSLLYSVFTLCHRIMVGNQALWPAGGQDRGRQVLAGQLPVQAAGAVLGVHRDRRRGHRRHGAQAAAQRHVHHPPGVQVLWKIPASDQGRACITPAALAGPELHGPGLQCSWDGAFPVFSCKCMCMLIHIHKHKHVLHDCAASFGPAASIARLHGDMLRSSTTSTPLHPSNPQACGLHVVSASSLPLPPLWAATWTPSAAIATMSAVTSIASMPRHLPGVLPLQVQLSVFAAGRWTG